MMKRKLTALLLTAVLSTGMVVPASAQTVFGDVSAGDYYYKAVSWAVESGVTNGTSATTFSPDITCTQAQVLTFLWRSYGAPEGYTIENPYQDPSVTPDQYFYDALMWAYINEIVTDMTLSPNDGCSRKDVVLYLWRYVGAGEYDPPAFDDVPASADYAQAVAWAVKAGVTTGTSATTFSPDTICTRGQIVTFLYRVFLAQTQDPSVYPGDLTVPDFGLFTGVPLLQTEETHGYTGYLYSTADLGQTATERENTLLAYIDFLEGTYGFTFFHSYDSNGVGYFLYRSDDSVVALAVSGSQIGVVPLDLPYLLRFTSSDGKYYTSHPNVPDFGVVIGAPPFEWSQRYNGWTFSYRGEDATEQEITNYHNLLLAEGFQLVGNENNYGQSFLIYEKGSTSVWFGTAMNSLMVAVYI